MAVKGQKYFDAAQKNPAEIAEALKIMFLEKGQFSGEPTQDRGVFGFAGAKDTVLQQAAFSGNATGLMPTSNSPLDTGMGGSSGKENEEEKSRKAFEAQMLAQIAQLNENIRMCNELADRYHELAQKAGEKADKIASDMVENTDFLNEADDILDDLGTGKKFDRERTIRALKKKGIDVDPNTSDEKLQELLRQQQQKIAKEQEELGKKYDYWAEQEKELSRKEKLISKNLPLTAAKLLVEAR